MGIELCAIICENVYVLLPIKSTFIVYRKMLLTELSFILSRRKHHLSQIRCCHLVLRVRTCVMLSSCVARAHLCHAFFCAVRAKAVILCYGSAPVSIAPTCYFHFNTCNIFRNVGEQKQYMTMLEELGSLVDKRTVNTFHLVLPSKLF